MEEKKSLKRVLSGKVVKFSGEKTISVVVERKFAHPKYGRIVKRFSKYLVHNDGSLENVALGDQVQIQESKPISKKKNWILLRVVK